MSSRNQINSYSGDTLWRKNHGRHGRHSQRPLISRRAAAVVESKIEKTGGYYFREGILEKQKHIRAAGIGMSKTTAGVSRTSTNRHEWRRKTFLNNKEA